MRISLIRSRTPLGNPGLSESFEEKKLSESLAIGYLDAYIKVHGPAHWRTQLLNPTIAGENAEQSARHILAFAPQVLGISITYEWQVPFATSLATQVRTALPNTCIVVATALGRLPSTMGFSRDSLTS